MDELKSLIYFVLYMAPTLAVGIRCILSRVNSGLECKTQCHSMCHNSNKHYLNVFINSTFHRQKNSSKITSFNHSLELLGLAMLSIFTSLILNDDVFSLIPICIAAAMLDNVVPLSPLSSRCIQTASSAAATILGC